MLGSSTIVAKMRCFVSGESPLTPAGDSLVLVLIAILLTSPAAASPLPARLISRFNEHGRWREGEQRGEGGKTFLREGKARNEVTY